MDFQQTLDAFWVIDNVVSYMPKILDAYKKHEFTFFVVGMICLVYVLFIRKGKLTVKQETPKFIGAIFETAGQFAYIFAIADEEHIMLSAPIISAYCVASVIWGRLFLKEKLSWKHYAAIAVVVVGIVIIGIYDI